MNKITEIPTVGQLEAELKREKYRHQYGRVLRSTIFTLITVAAVAILVATLWTVSYTHLTLPTTSRV